MYQLNKKCEMCGARVTIRPDGRSAQYEFCGCKYTFAAPVTEKSAGDLDRSNNYRLKNMFDNAIVECRALLNRAEYAKNPEAHWGLFLSEYGIEYVHDKNDGRYVRPAAER